MKIIIPIIGFGRAGGERVLAKLATELIGQHNENDVIFVKPGNGSVPYYSTDANIVESAYYCNGMKIFDYIRNLIGLVQLCRQLNPDVVIANYFITAYLAIFLSSKTSKFYYVQANESKINKRIGLKILAFASYFLPLKKIVNSEKLLPEFLNNYISIIPAGIDLSLFKNERQKIKKGKWKIGFVGRKEKYKASDEIVDVLISLNKILDEKVEVHVALYLSDENRRKLDVYTFHEINSDADLAIFYSTCDIVIAVGLVEDGAFHYPCAEAMASGCLVISNYAPLSNSLLLLDKFSPEAVLNKLRYCIESLSDKEMEFEIMKNLQIISEYSWEKIGAKFLNVISTNK